MTLEMMVTLGIASGTGLLYLGIWLGRLSASVRSAHHRIDELHETLVRELRSWRVAAIGE